ncbi:hypothetical protein TRFO_40898 [Tritrichomonas foetus]|uniref:Mitochondrial import inner membrane translocase subunit TIM50 n=1 Tax=Tritrichomonas foetus TaxID=1144522 RepID=A0A1J4J6J3_9EUKA|nr:hypothetical protein TRFO_40898 [Tritrichomonas foetus]|eukprot:OHS92796.1 hypothetical protein TRFO_40898 [Tritrichomonas foetus]
MNPSLTSIRETNINKNFILLDSSGIQHIYITQMTPDYGSLLQHLSAHQNSTDIEYIEKVQNDVSEKFTDVIEKEEKDNNLNEKKYSIVFDLDNTLIYSTIIPTENTSFSVQCGPRNRKVYIQVRPGLQDFIRRISEIFDIYFFTVTHKDYSRQVIERIAPFVNENHCFYREDCIFKDGYEVKDLRLLNKPLSRTIMVDDIQGSCLLQPFNSIVIPPFYGDPNDDILQGELLPLLLESSKEDELLLNIRKYVEQLSPHLLLYYK